MFEKATIRPSSNLKNTEVEPVRLARYYSLIKTELASFEISRSRRRKG